MSVLDLGVWLAGLDEVLRGGKWMDLVDLERLTLSYPTILRSILIFSTSPSSSSSFPPPLVLFRFLVLPHRNPSPTTRQSPSVVRFYAQTNLNLNLETSRSRSHSIGNREEGHRDQQVPLGDHGGWGGGLSILVSTTTIFTWVHMMGKAAVVLIVIVCFTF